MIWIVLLTTSYYKLKRSSCQFHAIERLFHKNSVVGDIHLSVTVASLAIFLGQNDVDQLIQIMQAATRVQHKTFTVEDPKTASESGSRNTVNTFTVKDRDLEWLMMLYLLLGKICHDLNRHYVSISHLVLLYFDNSSGVLVFLKAMWSFVNEFTKQGIFVKPSKIRPINFI